MKALVIVVGCVTALGLAFSPVDAGLGQSCGPAVVQPLRWAPHHDEGDPTFSRSIDEAFDAGCIGKGLLRLFFVVVAATTTAALYQALSRSEHTPTAAPPPPRWPPPPPPPPPPPGSMP